jgi:Holliday junction resolvase
MNGTRKGTRRERQSRDIQEAAGDAVTRAAGSGGRG